MFGQQKKSVEDLKKEAEIANQKYQEELQLQKAAEAEAKLKQRQLEQKQKYEAEQAKKFSLDKNLTERIFALVIFVARNPTLEYQKVIYSQSLKRKTTTTAIYSIPELMRLFKIPLDLLDGDDSEQSKK